MNQPQFFLFLQGRLTAIDANKIIFIESNNNYSRIHTREQVYTIILQLHSLERKLPPEHFIRVHRQYIISLKHIKHVSRQSVNMGEKEIPISGKYYQDLIRKLIVLK